jgi:hypothetical protein
MQIGVYEDISSVVSDDQTSPVNHFLEAGQDRQQLGRLTRLF